jgi:beta-glucanase (GH16 family)
MAIDTPQLSEFHKEFFILLNIAVGGSHAGRPDNTTEFPQKMIIDWIRVYEEV